MTIFASVIDKEKHRAKYANPWNPYEIALHFCMERLQAMMYPSDHPYHHSVIGSMEDLDAASLEDVEQFFRTYYAPNNAVLSIVGDFDEAQARELVQRYFGEIPPARATVGVASLPRGARVEILMTAVR